MPVAYVNQDSVISVKECVDHTAVHGVPYVYTRVRMGLEKKKESEYCLWIDKSIDLSIPWEEWGIGGGIICTVTKNFLVD